MRARDRLARAAGECGSSGLLLVVRTEVPTPPKSVGWPAWWGYEPNKWQLVPLNERVCLKGDWISMRTRILAG